MVFSAYLDPSQFIDGDQILVLNFGGLSEGWQMRVANTITIILFSLMFIGCDNNNDNNNKDVALTPASDCLWIGPYIKENESLNFGYLDTGAAYWIAIYNLPEDGSHITLENQFPYSRYMSFTSYRVVGGVVDELTDREIIPNNGATNPYVEGNPRKDPSRGYLYKVSLGDPPDDTGSNSNNILYDGAAKAGDPAVIIYRNYVPNTGTDAAGDVGLPRVTLNMADGTVLQGQDACDILHINYTPPASLYPADDYANLRGSSDPSLNPPVFRASYTRDFQFQCNFGGDCTNNPPRDNSGFPNADAAYMYAFLSRQYGEVLVLRGRIPRTPATLDGRDTVFKEAQLRYWSMCQYEYYSQKVEACLFDEQVKVNDDGFFTIVTSRSEDRPDNAQDDCGVGFIPWSANGDGFGIVEGRESYADDGYLLVRNMLPAPDFMQAIQNTSVSGDEAAVLGEYLPKGRYFSKAEFESLGCNPWLVLPYDGME